MMHHDVDIIGAGQAGLATGKLLEDAGSNFVALYAQERIGAMPGDVGTRLQTQSRC